VTDPLLEGRDRLILAAEDPLLERGGGLQTLMRGFLANCREPERYAVAGPDWGDTGRWQPRAYRDREFPFRRLHMVRLPISKRLRVSAAAARDLRSLRGFPTVYSHGPELLLPFVLGRYPGRLVLHVLGNLRAEVAYGATPFLRNMAVQHAYAAISLAVMRRCSRILWVEGAQLAEMPEEIRTKSEILGTFYDDDVFRSAPHEREGDPTLLVVARLEPIKRIDLVLRAVAHARAEGERWRLIVCGRGAVEDDLRRLAGELGLNGVVEWRIEYEGSEDLAALMRRAHAGLLVSEAEGSPTVIKEMLACGLPVVGTRVGDNELVIRDGVTGAIVEPRPDSVVAGIRRALALQNVADTGPASVAPHALAVWAKRLEKSFND